MYAWGFRNPLEAVRELSSVEDTELQAFLVARMLAGWAHGEYRDSASEYIASLPDSSIRRRYLTTLVWEISKEGPEALMRWAEGVPDDLPRVKRAIFQEAAGTLAGVDAPSAARWLRGHLDRDYADDALVVLAGAWATSDAPAAMSWLVELPTSKQRNAAVKASFRIWFNRSPDDAERWLRSASPARAVNPAVRIMVERTRNEKPEISRKWAARIARGR